VENVGYSRSMLYVGSFNYRRLHIAWVVITAILLNLSNNQSPVTYSGSTGPGRSTEILRRDEWFTTDEGIDVYASTDQLQNQHLMMF
jgi:hypothetical protein